MTTSDIATTRLSPIGRAKLTRAAALLAELIEEACSFEGMSLDMLGIPGEGLPLQPAEARFWACRQCSAIMPLDTALRGLCIASGGPREACQLPPDVF